MLSLYYLDLAVVLLAWLTSAFRFKKADTGARLISLLLGLTFLAESLAFLFAKVYRNNLAVYGVFNPFQLLFISLYFNQVIDVFRARYLGWILGALGLIVGVLNVVLLQPLNTLNSYFLLFEGVLVISMSLFSFARLMLRDDSLRIQKNPDFWFATIFTFFWALTFFSFGLYGYIEATRPVQLWMVHALLIAGNLITYTGLGLVFLLYPTLRRSDDR